MHKSSDWRPAKPVVFATLLCLLMLGGDIVSGGRQNPMAVVFYCFLPAVLWMIANEQKRAAQSISGLKGRIDQLEESLRASDVSRARLVELLKQ